MVENEDVEGLLEGEHRFIEDLKQRRQELGWSQTELARHMVKRGWTNYTQMTVSRTEKFERPLRLSEGQALASILGAPFGIVPSLREAQYRNAIGRQLSAIDQHAQALTDSTVGLLGAMEELEALISDPLAKDLDELVQLTQRVSRILGAVSPEARVEKARARFELEKPEREALRLAEGSIPGV